MRFRFEEGGWFDATTKHVTTEDAVLAGKRPQEVHLPLTSKPKMSNKPEVATSMRLRARLFGDRCVRSARLGPALEAKSVLLVATGLASVSGMANANTITAKSAMRSRRRNITVRVVCK